MDTQEIVNSYLAKKTYPETEDGLDIDDLLDLFDESIELGRAGSVAVLLPPTPYESPLKDHFNKLRGSPTKASRPLRRSPAKTRPRSVLEELDDVSFLDNLELVRPSAAAANGREFEKYTSMLASSTDKMVRELQAERAKNSELARRLAAVEGERFSARVTQSDHELLQREHAALQQQCAALQDKCARLEQQAGGGARLARENELLREKLAKYKRLYDAARVPGAGAPASEGLARSVEEDPHDVQHALCAILAAARTIAAHSATQVALQIALDQPALRAPAHTQNTVAGGPSTVPGAAAPSGEAATGPAGEQPHVPEVVEPSIVECVQHLAHLAENVSQIGHEMAKVNATLKAGTPQRCAPCSGVSSRVLSRPNTADDGSTQLLMGKYSWNRTV